MSLSKLVKSTVINGSNIIATAVREGITYRLEPVEVMKEVRFHDFEKNKTKIIRLADYLDQDYRIVGVTVDFAEDDDEPLPDGNRNPANLYCNAYVRIINQEKAAENIYMTLSSYPPYVNKLYINHNDTWAIKLTRDVKKITFRCTATIVDNAINIP